MTPFEVHPVEEDQWGIVGWLWQLFRHDLAREVIGRHDGQWEIAFQHDNLSAGAFWRRVATAAWADGWAETTEPVPGRPDIAPDHWIRTR